MLVTFRPVGGGYVSSNHGGGRGGAQEQEEQCGNVKENDRLSIRRNGK
jgi:hypothetical protein